MRKMMLMAAALSLAAAYLPLNEPQLGAQQLRDRPLEARLFPTHLGQVPLRLNQPAYVALFEVVPGAGVSLVYPRHGAGFTASRDSWISLHYSPQRWIYQTSAASYRNFGRDRYSHYSQFGTGAHMLEPPRYLFLVASLDPIDIEQFQGSGTALRRHLGFNYTSYRPYEVMEQLAYALLPYSGDDRWVTDVVADWGYDWGTGYGGGATAATMTWVPILCRDGTLRYAPYIFGWGVSSLPCQPASSGTPPGTGLFPPGPTPPAPPSDSAVEERDREARAGEGRTRTIITEANELSRDLQLSDEQRRRIAELRADAARSGFSQELGERLRHNVAERQRSESSNARGATRELAPFPERRGGMAAPRAGTSRDATARDAARRDATPRDATPRDATAGESRPRDARSRGGEPRGENVRPSSTRESPRGESPRGESPRGESPRGESPRVEGSRGEARPPRPQTETPRPQAEAPRPRPEPQPQARAPESRPAPSSEPSQQGTGSGRSRVPPPDPSN